MKKKIIPFVSALLMLVSCQSVHHVTNQDLRSEYRTAMSIAVYPDSAKIDTNLVQIPGNPNLIWKTFNGEQYVLMVSWKSGIYYPRGGDSLYNTGTQYPVWVTAAPQLQNWFHQQNVTDTNLRLKQVLGLPDNSTQYPYFFEFWVRPADLFRPCPDNEINDKSCGTCFPNNTPAAYIDWMNQTRIARYYQCDLYNQYPWTQLGYTFDWNPNNPTHVGMSEFVIRNNANIYVKGVSTTKQYLDH